MDDQSLGSKKGTEGASKDDAPYEPEYKGFDEKTTRQAQATHERSQEGKTAQGMDANNTYVDDGPEEAARRTGRSAEDIGSSIEDAAKRSGRGKK